MALLEGLDAIDWAALEDAYGPSVDTPRHLRAVREGGEAAADALWALEAAVFHQGGYYAAAAPAARFLVELATSTSVPVRGPILTLLAEMSAGHADDLVQGHDPFAFESAPGLPDYPEAQRTIQEITRASARYLPLLADADPFVRAGAAYLIGGLALDDPTEVTPALVAALAREEEPAVAASMTLAWARQRGSGEPARPPDTNATGAIVDAAVAVAAAWRGHPDLDALEAAALAAPDEEAPFPWAQGSVAALAVTALGRAPGSGAALGRVLQGWLRRGGPLEPFHWSDWSDEPPSLAGSPRERLVRSAMAFLARDLFSRFGPERESAPITVDELDEAQRAAVRLTADHGLNVPVPGLPWVDRASAARFLRGGGALDRVVDGVPLWKRFHRVTSGAASDDERAALHTALASLEPHALLDVCADAASGAYPHPRGGGTCMTRATWQEVLASLAPHWSELEAPLASYLASLLARGAPRHQEARLALAGYFAAHAPTPPELDPLLLVGLPEDEVAARAVVEALPRARRSVLVGRMVAPRRKTYYALCNLDVVARETVDAFLAPTWAPSRVMTEDWLLGLGEAAVAPLRARLEGAPPKKRALMDRVLVELTGALLDLTLTVAVRDDGLHASLAPRDGGRALGEVDWPAVPEPEDVARLTGELEAPDRTRVRVVCEERTLGYRLQRLLADEGVREVALGGSTLKRY